VEGFKIQLDYRLGSKRGGNGGGKVWHEKAQSTQEGEERSAEKQSAERELSAQLEADKLVLLGAERS
jgi:hypothetical protein